MSCTETHAFLKTIDLATNHSNMTNEQFAAVEHYVRCEECMKTGIADIISATISCRGALLVWASMEWSPWGRFGNPESIQEILALEHLFGRPYAKSESHFTQGEALHKCSEHSCKEVQTRFIYDGQVFQEKIPFLLRLFIEQEWGLEELLSIQGGVIENLRRCKCSCDRVSRDCNVGCVAANANIGALQELVRTLAQKS